MLGRRSDEPAGLPLLPLPPPGEPVGEHRAEARILQRLDHRVGVRGRGLDVGPVQERRDPRVDSAECREQVADVRVLRPERRRQLVQDERDVAGPALERDVRADVPQEPLPDVTVGVDEPGHDDHPRRVDRLGVRGHEVGTDLDDRAAVDQDVRGREVADVPIHREYGPGAEQDPSRRRHGEVDARRVHLGDLGHLGWAAPHDPAAGPLVVPLRELLEVAQLEQDDPEQHQDAGDDQAVLSTEA